MKNLLIVVMFIALLFSCKNESNTEHNTKITEVTNEVLLSSDIKWEMLNPARGDKSPKAGTIWGDRKANVATGFLVKFVKGFSSPPHIHNVSYRGIVINGFVHNDDANAEKMWMPTGSYWTQPEGEAHITAANANYNMAYIEIEKGPYLVKPTEEAFDNGERPINADISNLVWLDASDINWINHNNVDVAFLWGSQDDGELRGTMIKLPAGFSGTITSKGTIFRVVVIDGMLQYQIPEDDKLYDLDPGSSFSSQGNSRHLASTQVESIIYVRTNSKIEIIENE